MGDLYLGALCGDLGLVGRIVVFVRLSSMRTDGGKTFGDGAALDDSLMWCFTVPSGSWLLKGITLSDDFL